MTTQAKNTFKIALSILLVAATLLTSFGVGTLSVANAAETPTVTYMYAVEDGAYQQKYALPAGEIPQMDNVKWFRFDGWYTDQARTKPAPSLATVSSNLTVYGAYVFSVGTGDVNGDGEINGQDILIYRQHVVGGWDIEAVPSGSEWAVAQKNENKTYFLERAAGISYSNPLDARNLTQIRMAMAGGYGLEIYEDGIYTGNGSGDTLYYYNNNGWSQPWLYVWNATGYVAAWPGVKMTRVGNTDWYSATIPSGIDNPYVIFNNNDSSQTANLDVNLNTPYFYCGTWYDQEWFDRNVDTIRLYYYNNSGSWSTPSAYSWNGNDNNNWPGVAMTRMGNSYWYYADVKASYVNVIFSNNGSYQTDNLDIDRNTPYYFNGNWYRYASTIYYYNYDTSISSVNAYSWYYDSYNNKYETSWPGTPMTSVEGRPGWYSVIVLNEMQNIIFNDNIQTDDQTIDWDTKYFYSYSRGSRIGGSWRSNFSPQLIVDGITYDMVPNPGKDEYMLLNVSLKAGQTIYVNRFGDTSPFQNAITGNIFTLAADAKYSFYCDGSKTWVVKET